ncbi:ABC transporter ATP-binding protein [Exiguobacterium sp. SH5S4]|uniref:ABC transporter ATP-binding protein n=1 Tax=Exiguobacterium sp. SH5S4 TaxID=2510961 RepID=UPI00103AE24E|nr:ABC transporter ATP-binding protein [Exiguobacterium sp. SH5S4]TCI24200.1 ABC transporter ATP-binding protein [Exiguobacterium sp. SH5S4]
MKSLQLQHVRKKYGDREVINELDMMVEAGECFAIVGPSGCGKSLLLRMIAGMESPTSGTIRIDGVATNRLKPKEREVAYLSQQDTLYRFLTVEQNMEWSLRGRGLTRSARQDRCRQMVNLFELSDLMKRKPYELSGGERQRIALAQALSTESQIYLLDEPFSNLDVKLRTELRAKLRQWQQHFGLTFLYVTQDQSEAMLMADRMMIMNNGRAQQIGKPLDLYNKPANTFVASFLGTHPMNLTPVTRSDKGWSVNDGRLFRPLLVTGIEQAILGVRPEHILPAGADVTFYAELKRIEVLGAETMLTFHLGNAEWIAKWEGQWPLAIGEKVACYIAPRHMTLFDENGGLLETRPPKLFETLEIRR